MSVKIASVLKKSLAQKHKIASGDVLLSINDNAINDVLDYDFYVADQKLSLKLLRDGVTPYSVELKKPEYQDIGLQFETYLIDKQHSCTNKCVFCFVDQMPQGMRETLYFKDDDSRLSFLFGNYITLTNMKDEDIDRIIKMHVSPINISVHTTNPELRASMMNNRFAGQKLDYLKRLADANIKLNCQLVLCNGINDGDELKRSLLDLSKLYPAVQTIACVPVGLTKHREGLYPLKVYDKQRASETIDIIEEFSSDFLAKNGTRLAFPADEFFVRADRKIPESDYYEEFNQLENGVGIIASQREEFLLAIKDLEPCDISRKITIATGVDAKPYIEALVELIKPLCKNLSCNVVAIKNNFFGETITVAGLVTGRDLIEQLKPLNLGDQLIIPSCMLRNEQDRFLDDITLDEAQQALSIDIITCDNGGYDLLDALTDNYYSQE